MQTASFAVLNIERQSKAYYYTVHLDLCEI